MNTAKIEAPQRITARFKGLTITSGDASAYDGVYKVIPKAREQTVLPTKGKVLEDDVTVLEIPYFEVSNETGNTVYIGGEMEIV